MTLKLALAAVVVVGCGLCGAAMTRSANRRWRLLRETADGLRQLRVQIVHLQEPLDRALRQSGSSLFALAADHLDGASCAAEAWRRAWETAGRRGGEGDCLAGRDVRALERLFDRLGESGRAGQQEAIRACLATVEAAAEEARSRAAEVSRLYTAVGLLVGLVVAVLLI